VLSVSSHVRHGVAVSHRPQAICVERRFEARGTRKGN
jgi:hypothetical protein